MIVMGIGVEQADGDGAHPVACKLPPDRRNCGLVERDQHVAVGRQPFADGEAADARHQRLRPVDHQVVMVEPLLVALLDDVAKALGGDQRGARTLALDQRIGRQRGAMDEDPDIGGRQRRLTQHGVDAVEHAAFRGVGRGQDLAARPPAGDLEHDIGEGAADIGGELDVRTSRHERSFANSL